MKARREQRLQELEAFVGERRRLLVLVVERGEEYEVDIRGRKRVMTKEEFERFRKELEANFKPTWVVWRRGKITTFEK